ncbi:MAG: rhomboid family intramembrane serine protease [Anaerolineae bacterium]
MNSTPPPAPPPVALRLPLSKPRWTYAFLAAISVMFVVEIVTGASNFAGTGDPQALIALGANYAPRVIAGEYWRLFTANFLHIGLLRIFFNGYALYVLGQEVESLYGSLRFSVIFLVACVSGAVASFALTFGLSAGASTGIFGLIGTLIAFFARNRKLFGQLGRARLNNLLIIGLINVVYGLSNPEIDNWGHVGGFIAGLTLGWLLCPWYQIEQQIDGSRRVIDRNSLQAEWIGVGLFALLLIVAFIAALSLHQA